MASSEFVTVRVGKLPGRIVEVALNGDRTVQAAMEAAELVADGYEIRVGGSPADLNTCLTEGDTVLLVRPVRGN